MGKKKKGKYICIRECYYMNNLWKAGDPLPDGLEPGKHFSLDGLDHEEDERLIARSGDDPRSTTQMFQDLKTKYPEVKVHDAMSRKELFALWVKAEKDAVEPEEETPADDTKKAKTIKADDVVDGDDETASQDEEKRFIDMTPDEMFSLKNKEISDKVLRMYKKELKYAGSKKEDLLKKAMDIETKHLEKKVGGRA